MEIIEANIKMKESMGTELLLMFIDVPTEVKIKDNDNEGNDTDVGTNDEDHEIIVSWDLERDSIIQTSANQATE